VSVEKKPRRAQKRMREQFEKWSDKRFSEWAKEQMAQPETLLRALWTINWEAWQAAYAASLADFTMPLLKRIYDHLTGPPKESDFTLARELRDFLADSPSPTRIHDLREGLSWALDLLDMYDEKLIALGEPRELVYDALHLLAKAKARKALAGADSPSGTAETKEK
jgi:hypothetical protein